MITSMCAEIPGGPQQGLKSSCVWRVRSLQQLLPLMLLHSPVQARLRLKPSSCSDSAWLPAGTGRVLCLPDNFQRETKNWECALSARGVDDSGMRRNKDKQARGY